VERKIKVGAVSYLNTKPLLYGLQHGPIKDDIELVLDYPARLVEMLKTGVIDIGLVPVGALPELGEYHIVSDYCIGTEGEVELCKLLFEKHWKREVVFVDAQNDDYINDIKGSTAGLIIGDRALAYRGRSNYIYDLGLGWKEMTGLPFVFAVWVSVNNVDGDFLNSFNLANKKGLDQLDKHVKFEYFSGYDVEHYFNYNISYVLTEKSKQAMSIFLE